MSWDISQFTLSKQQKELVEELQTWLIKQPIDLAIAIVSLQGGEFSANDMLKLEQSILAHFKPLAKAAQMLKVLCKVVDKINQQTAFPLPNPSIPNLRIRPKNPFKDGISNALGRVRKWREGINEYACKLPINPTLHERLGALIASAVLHGALIDAALLVAFVQSFIKAPNNFALDNGRLSIELSISWKGESGSEYRIWYPDALTSTAIAKFPDDLVLKLFDSENVVPVSDLEIRKLVWKCLVAYFRASTPKSSERPRSLSDLLNSVQLDLQTRLPIVLTNYSARKLVSHSPNRTVSARLFGNQIPRFPQQQEYGQAPPYEETSAVNQTVDNLDELEPYWLADLRSVFKTTIRNELCNKLQLMSLKFLDASIEVCFVNFAYHLVSSKSASGNILAINTAKSYLITVAKRLGGRLGSVDPGSLDLETLENLYVEILEDADEASGARKQRRQIARALREFHYYLVQKLGYESINTREVLGFGKGLVPVDANLINLDEYHRIYESIPQIIKVDHPTITAQDKLSTAAQLIFMLAFKCGLRRMEVLKLNIDDFKEASPAELLIRATDARRLKTKSSTRKIPLYSLISKEELSRLRSWKKQRLLEMADQNLGYGQFLFGIPELNFEFIPQDTLFPIIHKAMRSCTQDWTLRFHHLRHSFATWTFLRLMLSDLAIIPVLFPYQSKTQQYLEESKAFREQLYGLKDPTRKHVYAIASLLGHSGPEISLEHYIHCNDVLLAVWLNEDLSAPKQQVVRLQSGRPQSTGYRWTQRGLHHTPFHLVKKRWPMLVSKPSSQVDGTESSKSSPLRSSKLVLEDTEIFKKMYNLLYQHGMHGTSIDELAIEAGYSEVFVHSVFQQMSLIRDMRVSRGGKGYCHRMVEEILDRRQVNKIKRLACPIAPHSAKDKAIQESLAPKFLMAMKTQPDLCRQVFDFYLNHAWQTRNVVVFKDSNAPDDAIRFISFLELIGIPKSALHFVSYDTAARSASLWSWKEKLSLTSRHHTEKCAPPRKSNIAAKQWLGIKPIFGDEKNQHQKNGAETGSIAFRFLMVLGAAIIFSM